MKKAGVSLLTLGTKFRSGKNTKRLCYVVGVIEVGISSPRPIAWMTQTGGISPTPVTPTENVTGSITGGISTGCLPENAPDSFGSYVYRTGGAVTWALSCGTKPTDLWSGSPATTAGLISAILSFLCIRT